MYALKDVSEIGLRIEAVQLSSLDDRHRAGERFRTGVGSRKQPVFTADSDRAQSPLGWIVVDGHTPVSQEQAEGFTAAQSIAECFGQIAFARNAQDLLFGPGKEGLDFWAA